MSAKNMSMQTILRDTFSYIQNTNALIASLVVALDETVREPAATPFAVPKLETPKSEPVIIQQKAPKENMTVTEAAEYSGYSKSFIQKLVSRKEIPFYKPTGRRVFFKRKELDNFLSRNRCAAGYEVSEAASAITNGERR